MKKKLHSILAFVLLTSMLLAVGGTAAMAAEEPEDVDIAADIAAEYSAEDFADLPDVELVFACSVAPETIYCQGVQKCFDALEEITGGKFHVTAYYSGALGISSGEERNALARGTIDMLVGSTGLISSDADYLAPFSAGFIYESYDHYRAVVDSDLWAEFVERIAEDLNIRFLRCDYTGMRHLNLKGDKKIETPDDMAGVKLRSINSATYLFMTEHVLGAIPVAVDFAELYQALQTGTVDGHENPLPTIESGRFYEVTDQIILTGHCIETHALLINEDTWQGLDPVYQELFNKVWSNCVDWIDTETLASEEALGDTFREMGLEVYEPDKQSFIDKANEAYANDETMAPYMDTYDAIKALVPES